MCDAPFGAGRSDQRLIRLLFPPLEWDMLPGGRCMRDGGGEGMRFEFDLSPIYTGPRNGHLSSPYFRARAENSCPGGHERNNTETPETSIHVPCVLYSDAWGTNGARRLGEVV